MTIGLLEALRFTILPTMTGASTGLARDVALDMAGEFGKTPLRTLRRSEEDAPQHSPRLSSFELTRRSRSISKAIAWKNHRNNNPHPDLNVNLIAWVALENRTYGDGKLGFQSGKIGTIWNPRAALRTAPIRNCRAHTSRRRMALKCVN